MMSTYGRLHKKHRQGGCKKTVRMRGMNMAFYRQCGRKAVRDGWCGQHHPDAEAAAEKRKRLRFARKWNLPDSW